MSTRAEMRAYGCRSDAAALEQAVTIIKRERVKFDGASRASVVSDLLFLAHNLRSEAKSLAAQ